MESIQNISPNIAECNEASLSNKSSVTNISLKPKPNTISKYLSKDEVTKAEIIWCLFTVWNHLSMSAAGKAVKVFKALFSDSEIASNVKLQRDKPTYTIVYGLGPYFRDISHREASESKYFALAFDESLNKISQKEQMDIIIRYWPSNGDRPKTRYLGSAFLGHTRASDLLKAFREELIMLNIKKMLQKLKTPWKEIFTSLPMWALIIVHCGQSWGFWMLLTEMPTYMSEIIGFGIKENGTISALPYLAMWLFSFVVSWLSDYASRRGLPRGFVRKTSNTIAHWGPALALVALSFVGTENKILPVVLLIVAVGLNAGSLCGFQINHIDLSPNFAGTMMSITNCIASIVAIIAPIIVGEIVKDQKDIVQWHVVFYISALIYFLGNLIFVLFGTGEVQWWNDSSAELNSKRSKKLYEIATIPTDYNPTSLTLKHHKNLDVS